jgi:hypothetical protein
LKKLSTIIILFFLFVGQSFAAKAYFLIKIQGGSPAIGELPYHGYVLCDQKGEYGAYLFTGTKEQLAAIAVSKDVIPLSGSVEITPDVPAMSTKVDKVETKSIVSKATMDKVNLLSLGTAKPIEVKAAMTNEDAVIYLFKTFNSKFEMNSMDVADPEDVIAYYQSSLFLLLLYPSQVVFLFVMNLILLKQGLLMAA